jgi:L-threonylcarbamoyladenylate synthase
MQTKVIKLDNDNPDIANIKEAANLVDAGELVAFPTETVYGIACRVAAEPLAKLNLLKGRTAEKYYTLHISGKNEVKKYVPHIGLQGAKLIQNAWPGPLTIVFELDDNDIEKQRSSLEKVVFENLYKGNSIGIRCPTNQIASMLLKYTTHPVVAPSANITGMKPAVSAEEVLRYFNDKIGLLLDCGPCIHKKSSTVVKIGKSGLKILREGAYSKKELDRISEIKILLVCTGNTCRSAIAEGMFYKYLAEKLECEVDQLGEKGYKIYSAGTMGLVGFPASEEAVWACATKDINIKKHKSTAMSRQLVKESDFIFTMSRAHLEQILAISPEFAGKCSLLAEEDIPDPIGQNQQVYDKCAELIEKAVKKRISEFIK